MNRIKDLREDLDLTQKDLGKALGNIPQRTISGYETETTEPPKEIWIKLSDFFGVSIDYLMGKTNSPFNDSFINDLTIEEIKELARYKEYIKSNRHSNKVLDTPLSLV